MVLNLLMAMGVQRLALVPIVLKSTQVVQKCHRPSKLPENILHSHSITTYYIHEIKPLMLLTMPTPACLIFVHFLLWHKCGDCSTAQSSLASACEVPIVMETASPLSNRTTICYSSLVYGPESCVVYENSGMPLSESSTYTIVTTTSLLQLPLSTKHWQVQICDVLTTNHVNLKSSERMHQRHEKVSIAPRNGV